MNDSSSEAPTDVLLLERRRHERLQPNRRVQIRCTEGVMSVFGWGETYDVPALLDLSSGGARLAMHADPKIGSILCLDLKTDEGVTFEAQGEIRWSSPGASGTTGFQCGVEFFRFTATQRQEIIELCSHVQLAPEGNLSSSRKTILA